MTTTTALKLGNFQNFLCFGVGLALFEVHMVVKVTLKNTVVLCDLHIQLKIFCLLISRNIKCNENCLNL